MQATRYLKTHGPYFGFVAELEQRLRSHHHVHLQHVIFEQHVLFASAVNKGTERRRRRRPQIIVIGKQSPPRRGTWSEETMSQTLCACIQQVDMWPCTRRKFSKRECTNCCLLEALSEFRGTQQTGHAGISASTMRRWFRAHSTSEARRCCSGHSATSSGA